MTGEGAVTERGAVTREGRGRGGGGEGGCGRRAGGAATWEGAVVGVREDCDGCGGDL